MWLHLTFVKVESGYYRYPIDFPEGGKGGRVVNNEIFFNQSFSITHFVTHSLTTLHYFSKFSYNSFQNWYSPRFWPIEKDKDSLSKYLFRVFLCLLFQSYHCTCCTVFPRHRWICYKLHIWDRKILKTFWKQ